MKLVRILKKGQEIARTEIADEKMQEWLDGEIANNSWGHAERLLTEKQSVAVGLDIKNSIGTVEQNEEVEDGSLEVSEGPTVDRPIEEKVIAKTSKVEIRVVTYYKFAAEYEIDITDITAQKEAENQKEDERKAALLRLQSLLQKDVPEYFHDLLIYFGVK